MKKRIKLLLILLALALLAVVVVLYRSKVPTPVPKSGIVSQSASGSAVASKEVTRPGAADFANALASIKSISIDTSIFTSAPYRALRDYPINLGSDIVGRSNPFAPVGSDGATYDPAASASQIQTVQPAKVTSTTAEFAAQVTLVTTVPGTVVFEYGPTDTFGSASTPIAVKASGTSVYRVSNLAPATTYYVRAILVQGSATISGNTMTFITSARTR